MGFFPPFSSLIMKFEKQVTVHFQMVEFSLNFK